MNEPDALNLDQQLQDVESQLRQFKPRSATFQHPRVALAPPESTPVPQLPGRRSRAAIWTHAVAWVSGVAVGCLLMASQQDPENTSPRGPTDPTATVTAVATKPSTADSSTRDVSDEPTLTIANGPWRTCAMARRVEAISGPQPTGQRLLAGSHLHNTLAQVSPPAPHSPPTRNTTPLPTSFPTSAKTRQQWMLEMLDGHKL